MAMGDIAQPARDHDRLVIAAHHAVGELFIGAEITGEIDAAEFVVERGAAERPFDHDVERGGNACRFSVIVFPGLTMAGNIQV